MSLTKLAPAIEQNRKLACGTTQSLMFLEGRSEANSSPGPARLVDVSSRPRRSGYYRDFHRDSSSK